MITPSQPSMKPHSHELCLPFRRPIEFASTAGSTQKRPTSTMTTSAITFGQAAGLAGRSSNECLQKRQIVAAAFTVSAHDGQTFVSSACALRRAP